MNIPMYSALSMLVYGKALYKNIIIIIIKGTDGSLLLHTS